MRKNDILTASFVFWLTGCAAIQEQIPFLARPQTGVSGVYRENLDSDRLVDLEIVKKLTGKKELGLFSGYTYYLQGYIRGVVVDYDDNPIEGIVVRVSDRGKDLPGFDPGISDTNGVYRVRFSLPLKKNRIDQRGSISYNPPWQQQLDMLGSALEPQTKETKFRLFFDKGTGIIGIGEDLPKTIVRKAAGGKEVKTEDRTRKDRASERKSPPGSASSPDTEKKSEDLFGGFGEFR